MKRHTTSIVALVATAVALVVVLGTVPANAQDVILDENFDSYSPGDFPIGWDSVYSGTGWQYQVVTNSQWVSSPNSFTMLGSGGWSAVIEYGFADPPEEITYSGRVRVADGAVTATLAGLFLSNKDEGSWGTYYCRLRFEDTAITLSASGMAATYLMNYNRNQWYHVKVEYDAVLRTASVWVDDAQVATDVQLLQGGLGYKALALVNEHGAKQCWFDDIYVTKPSSAPPNITLDHVDGLGSTEDQLKTDTDVRFHIRLTNDQDLAILAFQHGFQVYSPDGASWRPITLDTANLDWPGFFNLGIFLNSFSVTGSGADTVSLGAVGFTGGFPPGYDEVILYIETEVYPSDTGRHLCLDSAWFPPGGVWSWNMSGGGLVIPNWDGPHCWEIVEILNNPPVITNNPYSLVFDHCDMAIYDFDAFDQEGDPYWFEILAGPGAINTETGVWMYQPSLADVDYVHELVVRACDEFGCGPEEICYLTFTNMAPVFVSPCPDTVSVTAGDDLIYQFQVDDVDCDPSTFAIIDVVPTPVGPYYIIGNGEFTFETDALDEGIDYTFTVEVTDGFLSSDCILVVRVTRTYETLPGVSLYQIDFVFDSVQQYDSDWGSIEVDAGVLLAYEDADRLWINGVVDGEWVIQNLIVDSALAKVLKTYFGLRIPPGTDTHELPIDIQITLEPLIEILAGMPIFYPVGARGFNAEGASIDGESNTIIPTIMPPGGFGPYIENYEWVWPNIPGENIQAACNQCVPMSVANSLKWLANTYPTDITINDPHVPGLRGDTTLVGQLGECMERAVVDRAHGEGVGFRKMLEGKLLYLKDKGLKDKIVNKHQADISIVSNGWLDPGTVHYTEDSSVSSANETAPNGRVSWDWIYQQIHDGEDVELIYGYYDSAGVRRGGHAVRVFGAGKTNGRPWLMVKHDALQTNHDHGDTLGLQEWFQWVDTLDDGTMTFGSENIKVDFALSESPADHDPTLHFYQLDLILDDIPYTDLDWGELDLTLTPQDDTDLVYVNVTVNGSWQVENIPIWPPTADEGSKTFSIDFDLGVPAGSTITYVNYGYSLTSTTVSGPPAETGITVVANREGVINSGIRDKTVPPPKPAKGAKGGEVADPIKHAHKNFPNQECDSCECNPAAVSNSLKFLNKKHNMGLNDADLSIAKMKTACNTDNDGSWIDHDDNRPVGQRNAWWEDKKKYMEKNKIPVTTRKITDMSKLAAEIDAGQDVEIQGDWHCAALVCIIPLADGKYQLEVSHDTEQHPTANGGLVNNDPITYDPVTDEFEGSSGHFDGSSFRYAVVECPKVDPTPGIHRNPEDGYTPQDGSPVGRVWHEKRPNYCTWWAVIDWEDNGDDWFGYGDYVTFLNESTEETSREHVEEVTAIITLVPMADPSDTTYLDFWYGRPDMEPIVPEQGDLWHEIWPDYCTMYEFEYWEDNGNGYLDSCDYIGLYVLSGPDSGMVLDYHVEAIETDVISMPTTCCLGELRGNIDFDPGDNIDIADLVFLVDYMFNQGPAPPCFEEADVNCDGSIDIADLVHLVDYMFTGGPPPCRCDCADCPQ